MKTVISSLILACLVTSLAHAANDWNAPCVTGECYYDLPARHSSSESSGTLKIWGAKTAISDITPAAGWQILGCDPVATAQDIRLVCTSTSAPCEHLFNNGGAVGKIVRLPESCGANAFARVAQTWVPDDQSLPEAVATKLVRRNGRLPQVQALHIDTEFHAIDASTTGTVNFAIQAATVPGVNHVIDTQAESKRHFEERETLDFVDNAINSMSGLLHWRVRKTVSSKSLNVSKQGTIFDQSISCPPVTVGVEVDMDIKAVARVAFGVAAIGTVIPPSVKDFAIISTVSADVNGILTLQAHAAATLDSGTIKIFEEGLPGLQFHGILTIGPSFLINTRATATLDLAVGAHVGINYHLERAQFVYPARVGQTSSVNGFGLHDSSIQLSAAPFVQATGTVQGHVIPTLNFGVSAFRVSTGVDVALDSSAVLQATFTGTRPAIPARDILAGSDGVSTVNRSDTAAPLMNRYAARQASPKSDKAVNKIATLNCCVEIDTVLHFVAGADANFFRIIKKGVTITIFKKTYHLFKKCLRVSVPVRAEVHPSGPAIPRRAPSLSCLNSTFLSSVLNLVLPASAAIPVSD